MAKLTLAEKLEKKRLLEEKREARRLAKEKKEQEKAAAAANATSSAASSSTASTTAVTTTAAASTKENDDDNLRKREPCYLFQLSDDSLNHILWYLSARDLGALTSTCRQLSKALVQGRASYTHNRLNCLQMCTDKIEAETIVKQAYVSGGETGKVVLKGKVRKEFASDFVSYARFLDEVSIGYATLDTGNKKSPIVLPRFVNGRFVSVSPEHSLVRIGGGDRVGPGGSGLASFGVGKRGQLGLGRRQDERSPVRLTGGIGYKVRIVQVAAGGGLARVAHSLLLTSTGQVLSFGSGQYGALGHGFSGGKQLPDVLRPKYVDALRGERCICVSAGELHSAAVTADGDLYTWGDNFCGQLGLGSKRPGVSPQQVVLGGMEDEVVDHVSCGARHTLAVTEDGAVYSFGLGHFGVLGRSFTPYEHEPDAALIGLGDDEDERDDDIRQAMMNENHAGADTGGAAGAGTGANPPPAQRQQMASDPPSIENLLAHLDMIGDKELKDNSDQCIPKPIDSLEGIKIVGASAGHRHSLLLDEMGSLYSCGSGATGCLGHGDYMSQMFPMKIRAFDEIATCKSDVPSNGTIQILQMSAGVDMSMAVDTTGAVWGWGKTDGGRLGLGLQKSRVSSPQRVSVVSTDKDLKGKPVKAVDVECGYVHSIIVSLNGCIHMCGSVGVDGEADGSTTTGEPQQIEDINIWHRLKEPKEATVKTERWKKYGKYEVKGRSKNV